VISNVQKILDKCIDGRSRLSCSFGNYRRKATLTKDEKMLVCDFVTGSCFDGRLPVVLIGREQYPGLFFFFFFTLETDLHKVDASVSLLLIYLYIIR
jgi:hypothetical protein